MSKASVFPKEPHKRTLSSKICYNTGNPASAGLPAFFLSMNIYLFQLINYTLSFLMWMVAGRVLVMLLTGGRHTFINGMFEKITDPLYNVVRTVLPFAKVPDEKQGTMWWRVGGCIPFFSVFIIIVLRLALIILFAPAPKV